MNVIENISLPSVVILHFRQDEHPQARTVHYQCLIDPADTASFSPSGDFIRFSHTPNEHGQHSEVHGWVRVDDLVLDEVLQELLGDVWVTEDDGCRDDYVVILDKREAG